jgi:hypothetical protein
MLDAVRLSSHGHGFLAFILLLPHVIPSRLGEEMKRYGELLVLFQNAGTECRPLVTAGYSDGPGIKLSAGVRREMPRASPGLSRFVY